MRERLLSNSDPAILESIDFAMAFVHERFELLLSNLLIARVSAGEKIESLSSIRNRWVGSSGKVSRSGWITQHAVGFAVPLK